MASITLRDICLDYPLYGAYDFSLKRRLGFPAFYYLVGFRTERGMLFIFSV